MVAMPGIIYIATNPAMPGLAKIGYTRQEDVGTRIAQLFHGSTGVPIPFDCAYAATVKDSVTTEKEIHDLFADRRLIRNREFFWIEVREAIEALKPFEVKDVTPEAREYCDKLLGEAQKAARRAARKRYEREHPDQESAKYLHKTIKRPSKT
ncbi:MAG: GIY-YIG nuclease family protein [Coriobacteriia bacterium]|nr:GIY-YIG nuclease family protein [Coriobacteriia bacterium]MCL2870781.1 GIY-YIG nuclease family protein [Coriobacteriia bacterium]